MKKILFALLFIPFIGISQTEIEEDTSVVTVLGIDPEFPGGHSEMTKFIATNFQYPEEAREFGEQGTVWVEFVIMADGHLDSIRVVKGVSKSLDAECIRVIKAMPKWRPGEQEGKAVNVHYVIPFKTILDNSKKKKKKKKKSKR